jgi:hypothetical protein
MLQRVVQGYQQGLSVDHLRMGGHDLKLSGFTISQI